jgi:hypothetical protein
VLVETRIIVIVKDVRVKGRMLGGHFKVGTGYIKKDVAVVNFFHAELGLLG